MEDVLLVTGVLVLRPSGNPEDESLTCDGMIQFRPMAAQKAGVVPYRKKSGTIPSMEEDPAAAGDAKIHSPEEAGNRIRFVPSADEDDTDPDDGSMG